MPFQHLLLFCLLSALCGGNSGQKLTIFTIAEGDSGVIHCHLPLRGNNKFLCRDICRRAEDILIKTDGVRAQSGRYSLEYRNESSTIGIAAVTIRDATKSDGGRYRCGLGTGSVLGSYQDFEIRVSEASWDGHSGYIHTHPAGENITFPCAYTVYGEKKFVCKGECEREEDILVQTDGDRGQRGRYGIEYRAGSLFGLYVTISQAATSDTGWYTCGYGKPLSPDSHRKLPVIVADVSITPTAQTLSSSSPPSTPQEQVSHQLPVPGQGYSLLLVVCAFLVGVSLSACSLLIIYVWRKRKIFNSHSSNAENPVIYKGLDPESDS